MQYIVIARRPNGHMRMGWDTKAEQLSCAALYEQQGWQVMIADCETDMHVRLTNNMFLD